MSEGKAHISRCFPSSDISVNAVGAIVFEMSLRVVASSGD